MVVKEALASRLPVVSTAVGDIPDLVGGLAGCALADATPESLASALVEVLRSPRRAPPEGRARVQDVRGSARRLIEVYRHAVARRGTVCIVKHGYFPDSHVRRNAEALVADGFDVHIVCLRRPSQPGLERVNGITVHRQPMRRVRGSAARYLVQYGVFTALACLSVARLHLRRRLTVVEIDNMPDLLVLAAVIPRLSGARVVHYVMDTMPELWMELRGVDASHPLVRALTLPGAHGHVARRSCRRHAGAAPPDAGGTRGRFLGSWRSCSTPRTSRCSCAVRRACGPACATRSSGS